MKKYKHKQIEKKWQDKWMEESVFWPKQISDSKDKFYNLWMFPYPSAEGLHAGHAFASTGSDIYGRFQRMNGKTVFQPIGYDSFGIHSENFAIKIGEHPEKMLDRTTKNYANQLQSLGHGYDWTRIVTTSDLEYYQWTQWLFVEMFKAGLAYRKKATVNWCPSCKTVLADEQVMTPAQAGKTPKDIDGNIVEGDDLLVCERCGTVVEEKDLEQWFFRITDYADRLLENLDKIDWPEKIKTAQKNWIGKSEGAEIKFKIKEKDAEIEVFTTRPDTLFGATFMVLAPEHSLALDLASSENKSNVEKYIKKAKKKDPEKRSEAKEKTGVFTGSYAINPASREEMPIYVGDYILMDYGTGAIMGVPAHDQRDLEFAKRNDLKLKTIVEPVTGEPNEKAKFRKSIVALVKNPKTGKFLSLNWGKDLGGNLLVGGGMDDGEKVVETAVREIVEETGYQNLKFISKSEKIHHNYYAASKGEYRQIEAIGLFFELEDKDKVDTQHEEDEKGKFKVEWMGKEDLQAAIEDPLHKYILEKFAFDKVYDGYGSLVNSDDWNGYVTPHDMGKIIEDLEGKNWGNKTSTYHLRDWLISRQRYWGPPIPMVYCGKCAEKGESWFTQIKTDDEDDILHKDQDDWEHAGWFPEDNLPVELPRLNEFKPKGGGRGPLADHPEFYKTKCPNCGSEARRETDVSDTFLDSSWYFLAYPMQNTEVWEGNEVLRQVRGSQTTKSAQDDKSGFEILPDLSAEVAPLLQNKIIQSWLPVDLYFGGAEHAVLHLMYARFVTMLLNDLKYIDFEEPFPRFFAHGLMIKDGAKMSKSKGNVVNPDEYIEKFGADTLRLYLIFMGPMDGYPDFRDTGIEGMRRFVDRVWDLFQNHADIAFVNEGLNSSLNIKLHQTIKKVTEDMEKFQYNTSIAAIMELVNLMRDMTLDESVERVEDKEASGVWSDALSDLALLLAPFAPHITEEVWNTVLRQKFSIHTHPWPVYNKEIIRKEQVEIIVQVDGKTRGTIDMDREESMQKDVVVEAAKGDQNISKWVKGEQIKDTIFVPGRLVNFVLE